MSHCHIKSLLLITAFYLFSHNAVAVELTGSAVQGGLLFGEAEPGSSITLDGEPVVVSKDGQFVIGFGRDETGTRKLGVRSPGGDVLQKDLLVK